MFQTQTVLLVFEDIMSILVPFLETTILSKSDV